PEKVTGLTSPAFTALPPKARDILTASTNVKNFPNTFGSTLYNALDSPRKAGFLNIVAKANATTFTDGRSVLSDVDSLSEIRGDRVFAAVHQDLHDAADNSVHTGLFHPVDEALHVPPTGFDHAGSYKTFDLYGNL